MIWLATCPVCGLFTRITSPEDPHEVCKCGVPYDVVAQEAAPEPAPETPQEP